MRYNFAAESFYVMKFAADFSSFIVEIVQKKTNLGTLYFEEVRGGVKPWLMARSKARVRLPIRHNWMFSLALTVEAL